MSLTFKIAWQQLRSKPGRFAVAIFTLAASAALILTTLVGGATVTGRLQAANSAMDDGRDISVAATRDGSLLPPDALAAVRALPGVASVTPEFTRSIAVTNPAGGTPRTPINAVLRDASQSSLESALGMKLVSGAFPISPDQVVITQGLADFAHISIGAPLSIAGPKGPTTWKVSGVADHKNEALRGAGRMIIATQSSIHAWLGKPTAMTSLGVHLAPGADVAEWLKAHSPQAPVGTWFDDPHGAVNSRATFIATLSTILAVIAVMASLLASFLVYHTMKRAVSLRLKTYATLRGLGMLKRDVVNSVLLEAMTVGLISAVLGCGLGIFGAGLFAQALSTSSMPTSGMTFPAYAIPVTVSITLAATMIGTYGPAKAAAAAVDRSHAGQLAERVRRRGRAWSVAGGVALAAGLTLAVASGGVPGKSGAIVLFMLGMVTLLPRFGALVMSILAQSQVVRPGPRFLLHQLVRNPQRWATPACLLAFLLIICTSMGTAVGTIHEAMSTQLRKQFAADVSVTAPADYATSIATTLRQIGVPTASTATGVGRASYLTAEGNRQATLNLVDPTTYFAIADLNWENTDDALAKRMLAVGKHVVLPTSLAQVLHVAVGSSIRFVTSHGPEEFTVAGTYSAVATGPQIIMSHSDARTYFGQVDVSRWLINATRPGDSEKLVNGVMGAYESDPSVEILTGAGMLQNAQQELMMYVIILGAIVSLMVLIGVFAIGATTAVNVVSRRQELGVFRALGVTEKRLRKDVFAELSWTVALSVFAAALFTPIIGWLTRGMVSEALGVTASPGPWWVVLLVAVAIAALIIPLAGRGPAKVAMSVPPGVALRGI